MGVKRTASSGPATLVRHIHMHVVDCPLPLSEENLRQAGRQAGRLCLCRALLLAGKAPSVSLSLSGFAFLDVRAGKMTIQDSCTLTADLQQEEDLLKELGLDPSLLLSLSEADRYAAISAARAAKRAEERAEARQEQIALEVALEEQKKRRQQYFQRQAEVLKGNHPTHKLLECLLEEKHMNQSLKEKRYGYNENSTHDPQQGFSNGTLKFVSKRERAQSEKPLQDMDPILTESIPAKKIHKVEVVTAGNSTMHDTIVSGSASLPSHLSASEILDIKKSYLGKEAIDEDEEERQREIEQQKKKRQNKKITFKFEWEPNEDTLAENDLLYEFDPTKLNRKGLSGNIKKTYDILDNRKGRLGLKKSGVATADTVMSKPLSLMTARDWRIFRENYDIRVRGGKAPPPLRSFYELPAPNMPQIHPAILNAIENVLKYKEPSPIQRQAIPLGLQRRDLIAIAETGSGKTAAFGIPLCHYILHLPKETLNSVADHGPLALVLAPTRELALQIDAEIGKLLSKQTSVITLAIVGGQSIQEQAQRLRHGAHIVVGTPGRLNECIEIAYLILNQCSYVVLDEADRMIDLGFAPQIDSILDSMGGSLKSEDEAIAYQQEEEDLHALHKGVPQHRLTAMFSATMPVEVERIAKKYLRHPAVVSIGDSDSVKNLRILQNVLYLSSVGQKESALRDILLRNRDQKVIVFVNEKKSADGVARMVENAGRDCVVLHGGKAQEQREENLEAFRRGGVVLVATDVAGRGLDIVDVAHVINFDLPSKIENYTHRIGRTGRAGKQGIATSFLTDADETIMAPLKAYLLSTGNHVPEKLSRNPAAAGVSSGLFY